MRKRIVSLFFAIMIPLMVILNDYKTVMAVDLPTAFWGTLEASRAWFTAMQAGGAFDRGISFNQFLNTTSSQWQEVERKTMQAFKLYLYYRYQIDVTEKFPNMTVEEVRQEAIRLSTISYNSFMEKAINVSSTTKEGIKVQDFKYWQEFCKEFRSIAKNGLGSGGDIIGDNTTINTPLYSDFTNSFTLKNNIGKNTIIYDGKYYINKGTICKFNNNSFYPEEYEPSDVPTDRVRIPFCFIKKQSDVSLTNYYAFLDVNRLTGNIITIGYFSDGVQGVRYDNSTFMNVLSSILSNTNFPCIITDNTSNYIDSEYPESIYNDYPNKFSVTAGSSPALDWQYGIDDSLGNTAGAAIKDGNTKQSSKQAVREGSVPIKRSSLKEEERNGEKVVSGVVGWDIPGTREIEGSIADPRTEGKVIEDMGIIDVPAEEVENPDIPGEIVIPGEAEVIIPAEDDPIPIPIEDIFKIQYGPFYPTSMSITEFFPFCIPFDIYYCIQKFNVSSDEAPVIHLGIPLPRAFHSTIGEVYDVTVDFSDYMLLRNIIRYFILLSFIMGLMTITRDIIRG